MCCSLCVTLFYVCCGRYFARKTLSHLWPCAEFERISSRVLSPSALQQLNEAVELLKTKVRADGWRLVGGVTPS